MDKTKKNGDESIETGGSPMLKRKVGTATYEISLYF